MEEEKDYKVRLYEEYWQVREMLVKLCRFVYEHERVGFPAHEGDGKLDEKDKVKLDEMKLDWMKMQAGYMIGYARALEWRGKLEGMCMWDEGETEVAKVKVVENENWSWTVKELCDKWTQEMKEGL